MQKIILISLIILLFINNLKSQTCLQGTETNVAGEDDSLGDLANCVNCKPDYYFNGNNFIPGVSECEECPIPNLEGGQANEGGIATLAVQCDINCPDGTQTENGDTFYIAQKEECSFCQADYFFIIDEIDFQPGESVCYQCSINKASGSQATLGSEATSEKQCNVVCPTGTTTEIGDSNYQYEETECVYCNSNFYFDSNDFLAGTSTCKPCPVKKIVGSIHTVGSNAKKDVQCEVKCPAGTVVQDGKATFENDKSECVKCAPNFYTAKPQSWVAGIDKCFPCPNILIQGAQANYPASASLATQCRVVFSQFLKFSLLFIYFYFL
ncbi:immobilization antigen isoform, putative [Ichthyophthirius multifiliis]|uniref:Immobilization antigen isoform, putative n=1 Tax=Ichthyophthirius multifiliis TaxID=5932 RepID=G0R4B1_ICHMU|nr:immobilization antigen isoform, putative [Ichthyophthirius multifiliis]EGR27691.1 immobilization antigen isoform, putative [Ichthyophthirius multifiliis]|eukprot:XP_004025143.1 immobilization antigen isoform, putative [Ichthyophthirius multifiliis]